MSQKVWDLPVEQPVSENCVCLCRGALCDFSQVIFWPNKVSLLFVGVTFPASYYGNAVVQGFFKILIYYFFHIDYLHNCRVF